MEIKTITLHQYRARTLTSSLVSPKKYIGHIKDAEITFSDGSTKIVTFPNENMATIAIN
jgi:hypothetical protein